MADLIYREQEGRELLNAEIDGNFRSLDNAKTEKTETTAIDQRLQAAENTITDQGNELTDHEARLDAAEQQIGGQQVELANLDRRLDVAEPRLEAVIQLAEGTQQAFDSHQAALDPHPKYVLDSDLAAHESASDPHPVYLTSTEADSRYLAISEMCTIEVFAQSGTYLKRPGAVHVFALVIGGSAGAGSGRRGAPSTNRCGGMAGQGGAVAEDWLDASQLPENIAIIVGRGGIGGASVTTDDTNGNAGTNGGDSWFGTSADTWSLVASGGMAGLGGTAAPAERSGGGSMYGSRAAQPSGPTSFGAGKTTIDSQFLTTQSVYERLVLLANRPKTGIGGNGISAANIAGSGISLPPAYPHWYGASVPGTSTKAGSHSGTGFYGGNGMAGNAGLGQDAIGGGDGTAYGGGPGGGGASENGFLSGAGGDGHDGAVIVITYFRGVTHAIP
ncbi:hypothetical protein [Pseudomonas arsenicoxydans]|uniref:glycine-rich domain-containing protein n=1 Tax=Pseudomonas arsenicoxydans TaxID=702115 RepID=UPI00112DAD0B|nr:hypothetical protein [Pseudomonas arsenicoxydans]